MAYCTQTDIEKMLPTRELAEITTESGTSVDLEIIAAAISKADTEIDSYLAVRYVLPFGAIPARVRSLSVDMAIYYLYSRRSTVPEVREQNYQQAVLFLRAAAEGKTAILDCGSSETLETERQTVSFSSADRVFSRSQMRGY